MGAASARAAMRSRIIQAGLTAAPGPANGQGRASVRVLSARVALASAVIAALSIVAMPPRVRRDMLRDDHPFVPATPAPPAAPSIPFAQFDLNEPGLDPVRVAPARIDLQTGRREDTLMRGDYSAVDAPALRVTLTRGASGPDAPTLFVLMARRAAGGPAEERPALTVERTGARGLVPTKFGAVETLEITLGGAARRTCTGFVTRAADIRLDGWLCAPLGQPPDVRALGCMIDALSLIDLGDPETTSAFSAAPIADRICPTRNRVAEGSRRTASVERRAQSKK
jgi:hypothetical protein